MRASIHRHVCAVCSTEAAEHLPFQKSANHIKMPHLRQEGVAMPQDINSPFNLKERAPCYPGKGKGNQGNKMQMPS